LRGGEVSAPLIVLRDALTGEALSGFDLGGDIVLFKVSTMAFAFLDATKLFHI